MLEIKKLTAEQLKNKIEQNPDLIVINVLTRDDYENCHIKDSINISFETLKDKLKHWDKNKEIVVYCADNDCSISQESFELLAKMGFNNVWAYEGGMREWHEKGYPTKGPCLLKK